MALWILAAIAALFFLKTARQLLIPIALGVLLSYALEPVVAWLERRRVPRPAGASLVMLCLLGASAFGVYSLRDDAMKAIDSLPQVARRARQMVLSGGGSSPAARVNEAAAELRGGASGGQGGAVGTAGQGGGDASGAGSRESQPPPDAQASGAPSSSGGTGAAGGAAGAGGMTGLVQQGVGSLFAFAGHLVTIVFLVFFLLLSGDHFRRRLLEVAGPQLERRRITAQIIDDINAQIGRFLLVRLLTAVIVGAATWAVLAWMGVQQAAVWGALAGVFNSIPYFGPVIVSGGLLVVGLVQFGDPMRAVQMSGAALAITSIEGWLLTPPLIGKAERMNALVVFLGLLLWTWVWGAWGTILAVPMLVIIKSVADRVEPLKPVSRLMAP